MDTTDRVSDHNYDVDIVANIIIRMCRFVEEQPAEILVQMKARGMITDNFFWQVYQGLYDRKAKGIRSPSVVKSEIRELKKHAGKRVSEEHQARIAALRDELFESRNPPISRDGGTGRQN